MKQDRDTTLTAVPTTGTGTTSGSVVGSVTDLYVYPIKSAAGTRVQQANVLPTGLERDRRWMVVGPDGTFLTQRSQPRMALIRPRFEGDELKVSAPGMPELTLPARLAQGEDVGVRIWRDTPVALRGPAEAHAWVSAFLDGSYELVYLPDERARQVDLEFARPGDRVGFADGYPFLIISEASLTDLNTRLTTPLPMNRFRPSIVVGGCPPFAEDGWREIAVGPLRMHVVKPCARCAITTVDQDTGVTAREPLRTLATYRKRGKGVMFGQNAVHDGVGTLRVGDTVLQVAAADAALS